MADQPIIRLALYETKAVVEVQTFTPGTYTFPLHVEGNSLLSTVYVQSASGSVKVNYWDFGPGGADFPGERFDLSGHPSIATSDFTDRILVTNLHNKPRIEIIVTGGPVTLGVYITVIATFASDLDASLHLDMDPADLDKDKGLAVMCYDEEANVFDFIRCKDGGIVVTPSGGAEGEHYYKRGNIAASPGNVVTVLTDTVPLATVRKLKSVFVTAYNDGQYSLQIDGVEIAAGLISAVEHNLPFKFDPPYPISAGALIELKYTSDNEPNYPCPITAFLSGYDLT